ncbi:phage virion morphogenesis protein [Acinetobacter vivianii]
MNSVNFNNSELTRMFNAAADKLDDPTELGHAIANSFLTIVEDNFDSEGRPAWHSLSPVTLARRKPGKKLFQSGSLRRSVSTNVTRDSVVIGTNDPKAPTHQYGAKKVNTEELSEMPQFPGGIFQPDHSFQ